MFAFLGKQLFTDNRKPENHIFSLQIDQRVKLTSKERAKEIKRMQKLQRLKNLLVVTRKDPRFVGYLFSSL